MGEMPDRDPQRRDRDGEPGAIEAVRRAREASAYAAGSAQASWSALIDAARHAEEASKAWWGARDAEVAAAGLATPGPATPGPATPGPATPGPATPGTADEAGDTPHPVAEAELTVLRALPAEAAAHLQTMAGVARSKAAEARHLAELTGNLASQAARAWAEAEEAWAELALPNPEAPPPAAP